MGREKMVDLIHDELQPWSNEFSTAKQYFVFFEGNGFAELGTLHLQKWSGWSWTFQFFLFSAGH